MAEVIDLPGGPFVTHRVRIEFGRAGVAAAIDMKKYPAPSFTADITELLSQMYPLLVEHDAVLLQFGPEANLHPPKGQEGNG